ncbi:MerR family transcriptional regulator [Streptomyces sp. NBC_01727]|uniref:MerR family transcriptional regulator n=1 Tax=Streptomyces sp. NBC_01727 TaxID=2975924 RepID=UPI002E117614|nr:MerR family transcriptional regulator [Streptomyces sp. NBC_01727]
MRIGDISRETAVSRRLLRYYEEQGLLQPKRRTNGYREYTESDIVAVRHIRVLLAAGLPTTVIARILHCIRDDGEGVVPSGLSGSDRPPAAGERANYQGDYPAPGDSTGTSRAWSGSYGGGYVAVAGGAGADPEGEECLEFAEDLVEAQTCAESFGWCASRCRVQKA